MNSEGKDRFDNAQRLIKRAREINIISEDFIRCERCNMPRQRYLPCDCPRGLAIQVAEISGLPYHMNENIGSPTLKWAFQAFKKYCQKYNGKHEFIKDVGVKYIFRSPEHAKFGENYFATIDHGYMNFGIGEFGKSPAEAICKIIIKHNRDIGK